tara:strand:+ start:536 stop:670 length:135 start_codon:yes stop_codon:yes gene_type:complete
MKIEMKSKVRILAFQNLPKEGVNTEAETKSVAMGGNVLKFRSCW